MRVDEGRREHEPGAVDDAVAVGVEALADRGDRAGVDPDVEDGVDALGRVEDARAADDQVVGAAPADEDRGSHHATPATGVSTITGPGGEEVVEDRHPHDEPRAHLVDDQRRAGVGDPRVDLDAAVHRAGMHHLLRRAAAAPASRPSGRCTRGGVGT